MTSPNFYLFLKTVAAPLALYCQVPLTKIGIESHLQGARLNLNSRIGSHQIEGGQFMVLVPFTKKSQPVPLQQDPIEQDSQPSMNSGGNSQSAADSIWLDILGDISSMNNISPDDLSNNVDSTSQTRGEEDVSVAEKPEKRRKLSDSFCTIHDLLCSDFEDIFDQKTSNKICQLVESVNCLSDPNTGMCMLQEYSDKGIPEDDQCACPLWLRRVLKTFSLMNVLYAFFHLQRKCMTLGFLKGAFNQPNMFGLDDLCISYVDKLSLLCPKVVVVLDNEENVVTSQGSAIIIHDFSTESSNQSKLAKEPRPARRLSTSTVINAAEKRMMAFRMDLWRLLQCFMENRHFITSMPGMPSLEDIITLKGSEAVQGCINVKKAKSGTSTSRCCARDPLRRRLIRNCI